MDLLDDLSLDEFLRHRIDRVINERLGKTQRDEIESAA